MKPEQKGTTAEESLIRRLSPEALYRIDAARAAKRAEVIPILRREVDRTIERDLEIVGRSPQVSRPRTRFLGRLFTSPKVASVASVVP